MCFLAVFEGEILVTHDVYRLDTVLHPSQRSYEVGYVKNDVVY
jgi:hypothetical protein